MGGKVCGYGRTGVRLWEETWVDMGGAVYDGGKLSSQTSKSDPAPLDGVRLWEISTFRRCTRMGCCGARVWCTRMGHGARLCLSPARRRPFPVAKGTWDADYWTEAGRPLL